MLKRIVFLYLVAFFGFTSAIAQPTEQLIKVIVAPDHDNWTYKTGESVKFTISVLHNGNPIRDVKIRYQTGPEKLDPTIKKENVALPKGTLTVDGGTLKTSGFLRCAVEAEVDGKIYKGLATAGFDPITIKPTVVNPSDFTSFWDKAKTEL